MLQPVSDPFSPQEKAGDQSLQPQSGPQRYPEQ